LLLDEVPQIMRNQLYGCLHQLGPKLTRLNLGSGSGGSCSTAFESTFLKGIPVLKGLQEFTLRYDCSRKILETLSSTCSSTLRLLDVERSRQVTDDCVDYILTFSKLVSLAIFNTGLTEKGQVELLEGLPLLTELPRGDFLCDALEWLDETDPERCSRLRLGISEFWASEDYFFHHSEQLHLVSTVCPNIRKMLFMFRNTEAAFRDLLAFTCLQELDLWGGDFYADGLFPIFTQIGPQLTKLNLVHVEELDSQALIILCQNTPNLRSLSFSSCGFVEPGGGGVGDGFHAVDREARREERAQIAAHRWLKLNKLRIISEVGEWLVVRLVTACPNLTNLSLGMHTSITDSGLRKILASNSLSELRHFKCTQSKHLSMESVSMLLDSCKNLVTCLELDCWAGISPEELEDTKLWLRKSNIQLLITEEKDKMEEMPGVASNLPENQREKSHEL